MTASRTHPTGAGRWLAGHADELDGALSVLLDQAALIDRWADRLLEVLLDGGRLLVAGNGGSAAEAQHLTSELVGRFLHDRMPLSAICLSSETSALTAIVNDYGPDEMFARQVQAHGRPGDVLVLLSTSGRSPNILEAARRARELGIEVWALTGGHEHPLAVLCDEMLGVAAPSTAAIQAVHLVAIHALCATVDERLEQRLHTGPADETDGADPDDGDDVVGPGDRRPWLVVVGDVVLDIDVEGTSSRLSPDAPVPVVDVAGRSVSPGGAGLAALQAAGAGARVTLVAPIARDHDGRVLTDALRGAGVTVLALPHDGATRTKTRIRSSGQTVVRIDRGGPGRPGPLAPPARRRLAEELGRADAVLVADYGAGVTTAAEIRDALTAAASTGPMVWDPHPRGGPPVPHCLLVTPNAAEASGLVARAPADRHGAPAPDVLAGRLAEQWQARTVAVTVGARGAFLSAPGEPARYLPASPVDGDTCGAGDRFAVGAALALAGGGLVSAAVERGVRDASAWVAAGGAAGFRSRTGRPSASTRPRSDPSAPGDTTGPVVVGAAVDGGPDEKYLHHDDLGRLLIATRAGGGSVVATGGCFDIVHPGHVATLQAARRLGDLLVVLVNSDASVRRLKGPGRPVVPEHDRAQVLSAFDCVDAVVVFEEDDPGAVLERLRPDIWVKGGDYGGAPLPEAEVVQRHGGRVVLLPYLSGRSTTAILARSVADPDGATGTVPATPVGGTP